VKEEKCEKIEVKGVNTQEKRGFWFANYTF